MRWTMRLVVLTLAAIGARTVTTRWRSGGARPADYWTPTVPGLVLANTTTEIVTVPLEPPLAAASDAAASDGAASVV